MIADIEAPRAVFDPGRGEPPLGWAAVRAFESEHGIRLPEPYRTFVAEIADGCGMYWHVLACTGI